MTEESLVALGEGVRPCHSRAFLHHYCGMNALFGGDGYTLPEGSVRHLAVEHVSALPLSWPVGCGSPQLTCDAQGAKQGEYVVRVQEDGQDPRRVVSEGDLPSGCAVLTLVGGGTIKEYIAENVPRTRVKGLCSTPIGSPRLEACCKTIVSLFESQQKAKFGVRDKGRFAHMMPNNWLREGPSDVDQTTGARKLGNPKHMSPQEFAKRFQSGQCVCPEDRLEGVGFRFRRLKNTPVGGDQLANVWKTQSDATICDAVAVQMDGPSGAQSLLELQPRTCLELMLRIATPPSDIYRFVSEGHGFMLEVFKWEPWQPGKDPACCKQFPASIAGVRAFYASISQMS